MLLYKQYYTYTIMYTIICHKINKARGIQLIRINDSKILIVMVETLLCNYRDGHRSSQPIKFVTMNQICNNEPNL